MNGASAELPVSVELAAGERVAVVGCCRVSCLHGAAAVHGHPLRPGDGGAVLRSLPDLGAALVLEGGARGSGLELCSAPGCPPPRLLRGPAAASATVLPLEWRAAVDAAAAEAAAGGRVVLAVVGPKGVGKSTLARLAVNALRAAAPARACGLLDADCGAPELGPPGVLTLALLRGPLLGAPAARLGAADAPPALHQRFVGDTSPAAHPGAHAAALAALLAEWAVGPGAAVPPPPLVLNTGGWVRGLGRQLLSALLRAAGPSRVLTLRKVGGPAVLPEGAFWGGEGPPCAVTALPAHGAAAAAAAEAGSEGDGAAEGEEAPSAQPRRNSPADARALLLAAWAHTACAADAPPGSPSWEALLCAGIPAAMAAAAAGLTAARPFAVSAAALPAIALHAAPPPGDALRLLNGALVALLPPGAAAEAGPAGGAPRTLGLALVRGVDATAGRLLLLTPVPPAVAAAATALAVGRVELPAALLAAPALGHASPYLAHWALSAEGTGGAAQRSRTTLLRGART